MGLSSRGEEAEPWREELCVPDCHRLWGKTAPGSQLCGPQEASPQGPHTRPAIREARAACPARPGEPHLPGPQPQLLGAINLATRFPRGLAERSSYHPHSSLGLASPWRGKSRLEMETSHQKRKAHFPPSAPTKAQEESQATPGSSPALPQHQGPQVHHPNFLNCNLQFKIWGTTATFEPLCVCLSVCGCWTRTGFPAPPQSTCPKLGSCLHTTASLCCWKVRA